MAGITSGEVNLSHPHRPVVKLSRGPTRHFARVFDEYIRWATGGPIPEVTPGAEFHFWSCGHSERLRCTRQTNRHHPSNESRHLRGHSSLVDEAIDERGQTRGGGPR